MKFLILVGILGLTILLSLGMVIALYRHKKASSDSVHVLGETGEVAADLVPEGTVIVHGELWRARSGDSSPLDVGTRVIVVGVEGHLLVVKPTE